MESKTVVWVGRLNNRKGEVARKLATEVFSKFPNVNFFMVGGPKPDNGFPNIAPNIHFIGQVANVTNWYKKADLVVGAGRVALEAMQIGVPVLAVGAACYVGPMDQNTFDQAKITNFGDIYESLFIDYTKLRQDLKEILTGRRQIDTSSYPQFLKAYDATKVYGQVMEVYQEAKIKAQLHNTKELPVLMYHQTPNQTLPDAKFSIYTTQQTLRRQFYSLNKRGFTPITFADLKCVNRFSRPIILSFDDGYRSNYKYVLPLLKQFGFKAVFFVLGDQNLTYNSWDTKHGELKHSLMTTEEIKSCHNSKLVEIGSHGMSHRKLPSLTDKQASTEIKQSKEILEQLIGDQVVSFAYPYGEYTPREIEYVRESGYQYGVGTVTGPVRFADDLFRIRRVQMRSRDGNIAFWKKSSGYYLRYCRMRFKDT